MLTAALLLTAMAAEPPAADPPAADPPTVSPAAAGAPIPVYLGTNSVAPDGGIFRTTVDPRTGALSEPTLAAAVDRPGFLAAHPTGAMLYAVAEGATVTAFAVNADGSLTETADENVAPAGKRVGPCHVDVTPDGRAAVAANYGGGSVASFPLGEDGSLGKRASFVQHEGSSVDPKRQTGPHAHCATAAPGGRFVIAADLGVDKLFVYAVNPDTAALTEVGAADTPPGGGPRHVAFSPDGRLLFCNLEMGNRLLSYRWDGDAGMLTPVDDAPTLPADWNGSSTTAEVRTHPNGRFVYVTNRGHDSVAAFAVSDGGGLTTVEIEPATVRIPRGMNLTPDGRFLILCGQDSDDVTTFAVDADTGKLSPTGSRISVPKPIDALPLAAS